MNKFNKDLEKKVKYFYIFLFFLMKVGLVIFLIISFNNGNIEPAFWFMGISIALAGILSSSKGEFRNIRRDFIYSTIFFITAICIGGILGMLGDGKITAYNVFIQGHFALESLLTGLTFWLWGLVSVGIILGSDSFINAVFELFWINLKQDKRNM